MKLEYGPNDEIGSEMFVTYCDADHGVVKRTMESPLLDIWSNLVWGLLLGVVNYNLWLYSLPLRQSILLLVQLE